MKSFSLRLLYLYLFSFVGLIITVIGVVRLVDLGLKVYVFQGADQYNYSVTRPVKDPAFTDTTDQEWQEYQMDEQRRQEEENNRQRKRTASEAASMIIVGIPLYLYHWNMIQKENKV